MSATRRIGLDSIDTDRTNPLDVWGSRVVTGVIVLLGVPTLVAGMLALLS